MSKLILINLNSHWNIYNFRYDLIKKLQEKGFQVVALAPFDRYVSKLEDIGVKCFHIKLNPSGTNPITDIYLVYKYYKLFKLIKPNLILSYTIKPNIYGNLAARLLQIPVINNISGLGTIFIKTSVTTIIGKLLYKLSLASSAFVFFQNKHDRRLFIDNKLVKSEISGLIPGSGVNIVKFHCKRIKNGGDKFLFVGRLLEDKGVLEYLYAARSVLKTHPKKEFLLVGELESSNKTAISKDRLEDFTNNFPQIKYLGKTDNIKPILKSVDVMVLPSYREGLSKSLIEAASMNLPIITTNVPGCSTVVENMFNGVLCEEKSKFSLEQAIYKMINLTEKERLKFGVNGRQKVINEFSSETINSIYLDRINFLLS